MQSNVIWTKWKKCEGPWPWRSESNCPPCLFLIRTCTVACVLRGICLIVTVLRHWRLLSAHLLLICDNAAKASRSEARRVTYVMRIVIWPCLWLDEQLGINLLASANFSAFSYTWETYFMDDLSSFSILRYDGPPLLTSMSSSGLAAAYDKFSRYLSSRWL